MKATLPICSLFTFLLVAGQSHATYVTSYGYGLFPNGDAAQVSDTVTDTDGATSWDQAFSETDGSTTNRVVTRGNLADGSIRLLAESTGEFANSAAFANGFWSDTLTFDLNGQSFADISFSVRVDGNFSGPLVGASQGSVQARLGGGFAGTGAIRLDDLFGTTYSGVVRVFDGQQVGVSLRYAIGAVTQNGLTSIADSLNSAIWNWDLADGITYTSSSGVFLAGIENDQDPPTTPVPEPSTLGILAAALLGLFLRRRLPG